MNTNTVFSEFTSLKNYNLLLEEIEKQNNSKEKSLGLFLKIKKILENSSAQEIQ